MRKLGMPDRVMILACFNLYAVIAQMPVSRVQFYIIQLTILKFPRFIPTKSEWKLVPRYALCCVLRRMHNYSLHVKTLCPLCFLTKKHHPPLLQSAVSRHPCCSGEVGCVCEAGIPLF